MILLCEHPCRNHDFDIAFGMPSCLKLDLYETNSRDALACEQLAGHATHNSELSARNSS